MKVQSFVATSILIAAVASLAGAVTNVQGKVPLHVRMGNHLIDGIMGQAVNGVVTDVNGVKTNRYGGVNGQYYLTFPDPAVEESVFSNYSRCAPFVTMLLKTSYGWVPATQIGSSPDAKEYYTSIRDSAYSFGKRTNFSSWKIGDLLASGYYDGSNDTGHVMVVLSVKLVSEDTVTKTREYDVLVMDSSSGIHSRDTRTLCPQLNQGGVGRGTIKIKTVDDVIKQWAWSRGAAYYPEAGRPIVLGYFNG